MSDFETLATLAREITVTALLIAVIYGLVTGKLVTRWHYDEMCRMFEQRIERLKNGGDH